MERLVGPLIRQCTLRDCAMTMFAGVAQTTDRFSMTTFKFTNRYSRTNHAPQETGAACDCSNWRSAWKIVLLVLLMGCVAPAGRVPGNIEIENALEKRVTNEEARDIALGQVHSKARDNLAAKLDNFLLLRCRGDELWAYRTLRRQIVGRREWPGRNSPRTSSGTYAPCYIRLSVSLWLDTEHEQTI
jgi:hypothetical protein